MLSSIKDDLFEHLLQIAYAAKCRKRVEHLAYLISSASKEHNQNFFIPNSLEDARFTHPQIARRKYAVHKKTHTVVNKPHIG